MSDIGNAWLWSAFALFVVVAVVLDLLALERRGAQAVTARQALAWSGLWIGLALAFDAGLWIWLANSAGRELADRKATEFLTGYLIEKSLSVDNIFVFLMLFRAFAVPAELQKRALVIGVVGAALLRAVMILAGAWLVARFHWLLYGFGLFLMFTGARMLRAEEQGPDLEHNPLLRWMRRHLPLSAEFAGDRLSIVRDGKRWYTPLFVVVVMIGIVDVVFATDSIPAIFAITTDPFVVMSSNLFAILGLRALYFLLADLADRFHLLRYGLALVLLFIGGKMLLAAWFEIPVFVALAVVGAILAASMTASWLVPAPATHGKEADGE